MLDGGHDRQQAENFVMVPVEIEGGPAKGQLGDLYRLGQPVNRLWSSPHVGAGLEAQSLFDVSTTRTRWTMKGSNLIRVIAAVRRDQEIVVATLGRPLWVASERAGFAA